MTIKLLFKEVGIISNKATVNLQTILFYETAFKYTINDASIFIMGASIYVHLRRV